MITKDYICSELQKKGYIEIIKVNNEPYNGKDMFFCPQAPDLYKLTLVNGFSRIDKIGKLGYTGILSTKIKSIQDIDKLHQEINNLILNQDETTLVKKFSGCIVSVALLLSISSMLCYILIS
jgi:hypothetical protein